MALDQTANWTIQMADNLAEVQKKSNTSSTNTSTTADTTHDTPPARPWRGPPIHLPDELLIQILTHLSHHPTAQSSLASAAALSHQWYAAATPLLYASPRLYGNNFDPFARAICPSINLHVRKSRLAALVRVLDMGNLVHQGSRHMTARLLGRTKHNLVYFRAPQASFGTSCLPALAKCLDLRHLDLSLVSESPPLPDLFRTIGNLNSLTTLRLPRSAGFGAHHAASSAFAWPPNLSSLVLSGGIDAHLLHGIVALPATLRSITIEHCPQIKGFALAHLLRTAIRPLPNLSTLRIAHLPRLSSHALDDVLFLLPQLQTLSVSVDYVTPAMFDEGHYRHLKDPLSLPSVDPSSPNPLTPLVHAQLHTLELTMSGSPGTEDKISPIDVMIALDDGTLPALRVVRVAKGLLWHSSSTREDAEALADVLVERARESGEDDRGAGVWSF